MNNLVIYDAVRAVPPTALKEIGAGRLKGKSDINPMWRIKALTEQFGVCGFGWKYVIADKKLEAGANGEIAAFVDINLFVKLNGEWSEAIPGTGGSSFVANESRGLYVSDECFKMALTDAISVACKALGVGADVYWDKDKTKYTGNNSAPQKPATQQHTPPPTPTPPVSEPVITEAQAKRIFAISKGDAGLVRSVMTKYGYESSKAIRKADYEKICNEIEGVQKGA